MRLFVCASWLITLMTLVRTSPLGMNEDDEEAENASQNIYFLLPPWAHLGSDLHDNSVESENSLVEKRSPMNHQIVARLMGRGRNDEKRPYLGPKQPTTYFVSGGGGNSVISSNFDDLDHNPHHGSILSRFYISPSASSSPIMMSLPEEPVTSELTILPQKVSNYRRSVDETLLENKDAIQEYGRIIKKRARVYNNVKNYSGFLQDSQMFGHDVLFPAPARSSPVGRRGNKAEASNRKKPTATVALLPQEVMPQQLPQPQALVVKSPGVVLPGKFRIMK